MECDFRLFPPDKGGRPSRYTRQYPWFSNDGGNDFIVNNEALLRGRIVTPSSQIKASRTWRIPPDARAIVIELILLGLSNKEINAKLREIGLLPIGVKDLHANTLTVFRRLPECKRRRELLSIEAQQVAHGSLSDFIVRYCEIAQDCATVMLTNNHNVAGKIGDPKTKLRELSRIYKDSAQFVFAHFGDDLAKLK